MTSYQKLTKKSKFEKNWRRNRNAAAGYFYWVYSRLIKTNPKMIVFDSSEGKNYTGSPRAIYEYMVENHLTDEYECIWIFKEGREPESLPGNPKVVHKGSFEHMKIMSRAGVWIFDSRNPKLFSKKQNQHYIQTWHGTTLKKLALDIETVNGPSENSLARFRKAWKENVSSWDYLIVQNEYSVETFSRCFSFQKTFLRIGYPRNDILFKKNNSADILSLKKGLGIPLDKKIILYAPTYRDDHFDENGHRYFQIGLDLKKFKGLLGDDYRLIIKSHYNEKNKLDYSELGDFIIPKSSEDEISVLYLVSDMLITDYSSVMFDFSLLHKPMFFFCYDIDNYENNLRGFCFDFYSEAPGPISTTTEELAKDILTDEDELTRRYNEKRDAWYKKYHTYENGTACENIVKLIMSFGKE